MAWYPKAIRKPITVNKERKKLTEFNRATLHVAVSEATSLFSYFNVRGRADSHFYVRRDGTVEQYVDTAYRANADLEGNDASISIETQGGVNNPDTEPWTEAQVEAIAQLLAWIHKTHKIELKLASDSQIGKSSHGIAWHRLGIDGNFPALPNVRAGRKQRGGGMHWSTSTGKLCPGGGKIEQIPAILKRTKAIVASSQKPKGEIWHVHGVKKGDKLMGRKGPSTTSKIKTKRGNGFNLRIVKWVTKGGIKWGVTQYNTYYSAYYLKKGKGAQCSTKH